MQRNRLLSLSLLLFLLLFTSPVFAQIGYKDFNLGESYSSVIEKLNKLNIKFEERIKVNAKEIGIKNGIFIGPYWGDNYFYDNYGNKLKFTAKITKRELKFSDENGKIVFYFDDNNILIEIFITNLTISWDAMKQILIKKYGPPTSDEKDKMTMIIKWEIEKGHYFLQLAQYIDGSGRQVVYKDKTLLLNHWKKQYSEQKKEYDQKTESEAQKASGF